ncbi:MAG: phosphoenolpyruvate--protein phosphotransferase [Chloroherpetonaceae bacterium]|nr:phosphoenolpyruvate--protein phosphotransferase [Chloroherpetonaceae bacterium]
MESQALIAQPPREVFLNGVPASKGIASGTIYVFERSKITLHSHDQAVNDLNAEIERLHLALKRSEKELEKIASITEQKIGKAHSEIFTAQIMMLHDELFIRTIEQRIREERRSAEMIASEEITKYQQAMLAANEDLFRERVDDFQDLKERIIRNLRSGQIISRIPERSIVISTMLTPADVILFSRQQMLGCATESGGATSHAALICQSLGVPMVVGLHDIAEKVRTGEMILIDGYDGNVVLHPSPETLALYERKAKRKLTALSAGLTKSETKTACGRRIYIYSNIDFKEELPSLEKFGSEGVGLFRSETLFIAGGDTPSEEEQTDYYRQIAAELAPRPFTVRLFDVGGDKFLFASYKEANPNLGWRGVRILLDIPELLENQLRALLRANQHGNIQVMIPMVSSVEEVRAVKKVLSKVESDLRKQKLLAKQPFMLGAMIEVPSAVEMIEELAQELEFFSIGTNDLMQYTVAVDRNNEVVQSLYNRVHPALVRMIARIIKAARKYRRRVSMCGEMAANALVTPLLLGLGLREFSVASSNIPEIKHVISRTHLSDAKDLAAQCLKLATASEIEQTLRTFKAHYQL